MLQSAQILDAAAAMLTADGLKKFSVRGLARSLGVDPMALYHYFPSRGDLLAATAGHIFGGLRVPPSRDQHWPDRLEAFAAAYLAFARQHRGLVAALVQGDISAEAPVTHFEASLRSALEGLHLDGDQYTVVRDLVADYLNGVALSADGSDRWRLGFAVLVRGIAVTARGAAP